MFKKVCPRERGDLGTTNYITSTFKKFIAYLLIFCIFFAEAAPAMRSRSNSLDDLGEAEKRVRSLPRSYSTGNLRSNSPVNQPLIPNDQSDDSENGSFLNEISALEDGTPNSSPPTQGIISRERKNTSGSSTSEGEKQELKDPSPLSSGSRNSSPESSLENFNESFLKQAPSLFEARVEGEKAQAPVVVPPTKENIWKEIFGEFKDLKEENRGSTTAQPKKSKKDIREDFTETSSLLPKNGSIQEDGWVIVGSMETQQGSFTSKSSKDNIWLSKIPLPSWLEGLLEKSQPSEVKKKEKAKKGGVNLIIDPSEQEDESVPVSRLKGNEIQSPPSLNSDLGENAEKQPLLINSPASSNKKDITSPLKYGLGGGDPEQGKGGMSITLPEDLDPKVRAFLVYAKDYINDGKITLRQGLLAGIGGTAIGIGVGNAMPPIFANGLTQITAQKYWNDLELSFFTSHTAITLGIDSISRNMMIIGNLSAPSMEEFSIPRQLKVKCGKVDIDLHKVASGLLYVGAGFAALLPVYYLWSAEKWSFDHYPEYRKIIITFIGCLAPTLFLDSLFSNARALKDWVDEKINNHLIRRAFGEETQLSPAYVLRKEELQRFDDLKRLFRHTSDDEIHDLYEQVLVHGFNIKENGIDLPEETIKAADALRTLHVLRQIHKDYEIPEDVKENWKKTIANALGGGIPTAATVGRSLVFYTIISTLLEDLGLTDEIANTTLSAVLGGIIAQLFQGKGEVDAAKKGVYDILSGKETEGDASHNKLRNGLRKVGKGYNYIQGAWNTLPYILVGILATQNWSLGWQIAILLPFGIADMLNNAVAFNESYGGVINGVESVVSYKYATAGYKRNKLIRLVNRYKKAYEIMTPEVMLNANELLSSEKKWLLEH